ncbi:peptidase [Clostridium sp. DMHC 10]|nr:peptidase [Clostridium sp. DMHC 10]
MDTLRQIAIAKLLMMPAILIAFTFHEYAHAVVADKLGDKTPKFQGRITLNPLAHIDLIGFIMIVFVGFGWAKPVETNPNAYKNYYKDDLKVSIAGPLANLLVAFIFALITGAINKFLPFNEIIIIIYLMAKYTVSINCMFFLFNLIPIPGLDGFHVLRDLFPKAFYNIADSLYRYQMLILIALVMPIFGGNSSLATFIIGIPSEHIANLFLRIGALI